MTPRDAVDAQAIGLMAVVLVVSSAIFFVPGPLVQQAGRDAWLVPLLAAPPLAALAGILGRAFFRPRLDPVRRVAAVAPLRAAVGLGLAAYAVYVGALVVAETAHVLLVVMPETPYEVFAGLLATAGWGLAAYGEVAVARVTTLLFPVMLGTALLNLILSLPLNADFGELRPWLSAGPWPALAATPLLVAWGGEVILLSFWAAYVRDPERVPRHLGRATAFNALLLAAVVAAVLATLGPEEAARATIPTVTLARLSRLPPVLARVETAILAAWLFGVYVKLGILYGAGAMALTGGLGLAARHRTAVTAATAAASLLAAVLAFPELPALIAHLVSLWPPVGLGAVLAVVGVAGWPARGAGARRADGGGVRGSAPWR